MKATLQLIFISFFIYIYHRTDLRLSNRTIINIEITDIVFLENHWSTNDRVEREKERKRFYVQTLYRTYCIGTLHNDSNKALLRVGVGSQPRSCPRPRSLFLTSSRPQSNLCVSTIYLLQYFTLYVTNSSPLNLFAISHALLLFEKFTIAIFYEFKLLSVMIILMILINYDSNLKTQNFIRFLSMHTMILINNDSPI